MKNYLKLCLVTALLANSLSHYAQVPLLSSHPSAQAVIFLDFDGHTVAGTSWNYNGPIYCGAATLDNAQITTVFNRVAEDYRPFNVNVTTDSTKFLAASIDRRMRVVLTVSSSWYGSAGGVAYIGSFTWGDDTPCFVFTALLNNNVKNIAEATSHEAGHTLGLYHQAVYDANCVKISDYYGGQGSGEIGWAPIMGVGYYQNLTLWNNGPNSFGCNSLQSDLDVITTGNNFTYRADDHQAGFNQATTTAFSNNQFTINGVVERNTDQDLIRFTIPANGRFVLNAVPYNVGTGNAGSNLDMQVTLFNASQTQLNVYNPGTLLSSVIDTILNAGNYFIRVEGRGNIYAPNYASLGSYSLQGSFTAGGTLPLRRLELSGQLNGDRHQLSWIIDADEQVTEQVLEVSTDGRNFSRVTQPANETRAFAYRPYVNTTAVYRLSVTFDNGRQYYSNMVSLRNTGSVAKPRLVSNIVNTGIITVTSPGSYQYAVVDYNGRTVRKGQLVNGLNNIDATAINAGLYLIRFANGDEQWTDKFVRQ
jgi:hypothetical protein